MFRSVIRLLDPKVLAKIVILPPTSHVHPQKKSFAQKCRGKCLVQHVPCQVMAIFLSEAVEAKKPLKRFTCEAAEPKEPLKKITCEAVDQGTVKKVYL